MRFRLWVVAVLIAGFSGLGTGVAQEPHVPVVGTNVVTKYQVPLRVGRQVVDDGAMFRVYKVEQVNGDWLWLKANNVNGWVRSSEIIPLDQAIDFYTEEILRQSREARACHRRGLVWAAKANADAALADLSEAIRLDPKNAASFVDRGIVWIRKKDHVKARADFNEAVRLDPTYAEAFNRRGDSWYDAKEYDKALADYNEAIRLDPKDANAFNDRGDVSSLKKDYDSAPADYNEAIRLDPRLAMAFNSRARVWYFKGDYKKALADYNDAVRLDPKHALAFCDRGYILAHLADFDKALADFNEAIRIDPKCAAAFGNRGVVWSEERIRQGARRLQRGHSSRPEGRRDVQLPRWCSGTIRTNLRRRSPTSTRPSDSTRRCRWRSTTEVRLVREKRIRQGTGRLQRGHSPRPDGRNGVRQPGQCLVHQGGLR